ncbi:glycosyltransferase [Aureibaculum marinum]|uniref:Glycosyltransferase n=1 Tax=Aureibaculum marinum TaxID=2487930 RepID=A0A3N4NP03_9FLAO|nr:glycosyltransferase [Aureibaculum marinum]RPD98011.1 glycosyltransferase [Aureibaculum marinum]
MSKIRNNKILMLGSTGFPFGSATIQRQIQLAKSLINAGFEVYVINNRCSHLKSISKRENIKVFGNYEGIRYFYSSLLPYKSENVLKRFFFKILGAINEVIVIFYLRIFKKYKYIFLRTHQLKTIKYYSKISKLLNIELIYDYVEFYDSLGNREGSDIKTSKINSFDYNFLQYVNKVTVISNFLENHVNKLDPNVKMIKIPPIIDFDYFDNIKIENKSNNFFLFCGSIAYRDLVEFIINSYIKSTARKNNIKLKLVVNGDKEQVESLKKHIIEKGYQDDIFILSKLPYLELIQMYKSANALLIPIGNNKQDDARFPFKICEYTASKRPIITSNSGAIIEYFKDNQNAYIAKAEDIEDFSKKIDLVIEYPDQANEIGKNGYLLGKRVFNYTSYSDELKQLFIS